MRKIIVLILIIHLFCFNYIKLVRAETELNDLNQQKLIEERMQKLDLSDLEAEVEKLNRQSDRYLPDFQLRDILNLFSGSGLQEKLTDLFRAILYQLFNEIISHWSLLGQLIILSVIAAVLKNFQANFANNEVSKLANTMVYLVLIIIALNSFQIAISVGENAINNMVDVMQAILPVLLSLLISLGNVTSATMLHPLSFLMVNLLSTLIRNVLFPLIFLAAILDLVNNISGQFKLTGLASLLKQASLGFMGVITTVFAAVIVAQGSIAAVSDGVTIRTAKYLSGAFIPVIGSFVSNALDMIIGGSLLIKNGVGFFGVIIILVFCSFSIIKIIALVFIYRFAAAAIQPIGDEKIVDSLNKLGNNLLLVFAAVTIMAVMFFIIIIVMVATANFTVMLR